MAPGLLFQVPDAFLRAEVEFELPAPGAYAVGLAFLPDDETAERHSMAAIERIAEEEDLVVLGWREVPVDADLVGATARSTMPRFRQLFVGTAQPGHRPDGPGADGVLPAQAGRA